MGANDTRPSAAFSGRKNPQRTPEGTPPGFSHLRPCIWSRLLCLVKIYVLKTIFNTAYMTMTSTAWAVMVA
jgi:hypothetical protein